MGRGDMFRFHLITLLSLPFSPCLAQYIRLAHDTKSENVMALFKRQWKVELPKLVISVHGGIANFDLQPKLKRMFRKGG